jgi:hypothetical protein
LLLHQHLLPRVFHWVRGFLVAHQKHISEVGSVWFARWRTKKGFVGCQLVVLQFNELLFSFC